MSTVTPITYERAAALTMPELRTVTSLTPRTLAADLDAIADFLHTADDAALLLADYLSDLAATVRVSAAARRAA